MPISFSPLRPFSAVVFDMDGTLIDTESVFRDIVFEVSAGLGYEMTGATHLAMVGASHEATNRLLIETYGPDFPAALFEDRCREMMHERTTIAVPLKAGVAELLDELGARRIPTAIATSSRRPHAWQHLGATGILERFQTVVTRDDVVNPKPHPEPYLMAAGRLGIAPELCLAVEDSHSGVRAAHAAGMQTIMVPDLLAPSDEITPLCAAVMQTLHHLREAAFGAAVAELAPAHIR
jgi:HAD superfamily hydrolase (TIGR01509 family)